MSIKLAEAEFKERSFAQTSWFVRAPVTCKVEDLEDPVFWSHVAKRISALDEITVVAYDSAWYGRLLVTFADTKEVRVRLLELHMLQEENITEDRIAAYEVQWGGPAAKFRVLRRRDKAVIKDGFPTKEKATEYMLTRPVH